MVKPPPPPTTWQSASADAKKRHRPYLGSRWSSESLHARFPQYVSSLPPTAPPPVPWENLGAAFPFSTPLPPRAQASATVPGDVRSSWQTPAKLEQALRPSPARNYLKEPLPSLPLYVEHSKLPSPAAFNDFYQRHNLPVLIGGVPEGEGWGCYEGVPGGGESSW